MDRLADAVTLKVMSQLDSCAHSRVARLSMRFRRLAAAPAGFPESVCVRRSHHLVGATQALARMRPSALEIHFTRATVDDLRPERDGDGEKRKRKTKRPPVITVARLLYVKQNRLRRLVFASEFAADFLAWFAGGRAHWLPACVELEVRVPYMLRCEWVERVIRCAPQLHTIAFRWLALNKETRAMLPPTLTSLAVEHVATPDEYGDQHDTRRCTSVRATVRNLPMLTTLSVPYLDLPVSSLAPAADRLETARVGMLEFDVVTPMQKLTTLDTTLLCGDVPQVFAWAPHLRTACLQIVGQSPRARWFMTLRLEAGHLHLRYDADRLGSWRDALKPGAFRHAVAQLSQPLASYSIDLNVPAPIDAYYRDELAHLERRPAPTSSSPLIA